jgi:hypothetical protein
MDVLIFALTTAVAVLTSLYLFAMSRVKFLKKNWVQYRCNPVYMPMAGLVGDNVVTNFTKCIMKGFQDYSGFMMDPIMGEFAVVNETLTEVGGAMNSMREMTSSMRGGFLGIIGTVFGKIQNLISQFQYIIIRMRTLLSRIVGVMLSFIYVFYSGMETGSSVMNGPIGQTVSFLCFDPETKVMLKSGQRIPMKSLKIGDVLIGNNTITSLYMMSGRGSTIYNLFGVKVTGSHKVRFMNETIYVKDHPQVKITLEELPYLFCMNTDTHNIIVDGLQFLDFIESDKNLPAFESGTQVILENNKQVDISKAELGMKLSGGSEIIGRVIHKHGYQLITTSHTIPVVSIDGVRGFALDDTVNAM